MTIAAGFSCTDGIVLCADTQESYGEDKAYIYKLVPFDWTNWVGGIAGSGVGYLVDYASGKILEIMDKQKPGTDPEKIRTSFEQLFDRLYTNEFRKYPAPIEDKQVQMLIGVCDKSRSKTFLVSVDSTLVRLVPKERVIGTGELLKDLAHDFQIMELPLSQGMWIALYLVWAAKQRFAAVGGESLVVGIHSSGVIRVERVWDIAQKEKLLNRIDKCRNQLLITLDKDMPSHVVEARLKFVARAIRLSRQEVLAIDKRFEKQKAAGEKSAERLMAEMERNSTKSAD